MEEQSGNLHHISPYDVLNRVTERFEGPEMERTTEGHATNTR